MTKAFFTLVLMTLGFGAYAQQNCAISLDTNRMNAILPDFIVALEKNQLNELRRFSDVPKFIKDELNCIGNFKIAERGDISYQSDCLRYPSAPYRKVEYVGMNDDYLLMSYRLGGLVEQPHVLIVKFKDKKVLDIWSGQGFGTTQEKILNQLKKNAFAALNWI
jgi:hypothetical protein